MPEQIDARGLSCPQPVLMTLDKIKAMGAGELEILLDTEASRENVGRAVAREGWTVKDVAEDGGQFRLTIAKALPCV